MRVERIYRGDLAVDPHVRSAPIAAADPEVCDGCNSVLREGSAWTHGAGAFCYCKRCADSGEYLPAGQVWREWEKTNAECGMRNAECGIGNAGCGIGRKVRGGEAVRNKDFLAAMTTLLAGETVMRKRITGTRRIEGGARRKAEIKPRGLEETEGSDMQHTEESRKHISEARKKVCAALTPEEKAEWSRKINLQRAAKRAAAGGISDEVRRKMGEGVRRSNEAKRLALTLARGWGHETPLADDAGIVPTAQDTEAARKSEEAEAARQAAPEKIVSQTPESAKAWADLAPQGYGPAPPTGAIYPPLTAKKDAPIVNQDPVKAQPIDDAVTLGEVLGMMRVLKRMRIEERRLVLQYLDEE
jgi:hypothetical protein